MEIRSNHSTLEDSYSSLATLLREELESLPQLSSECCIYKVPHRLRNLNEKAYTPRSVSIGPIHHGREGLKDMEEHKKRYLKRFLRRTVASLEDYISTIKDREIRIRNCYAHSIGFSSDEFVTLILVDSAFIIELFLRSYQLKFRDETDRVYNKPRTLQDVFTDLLLLENQLPFFILEDLYRQAQMAGLSAPYEVLTMVELSQLVLKGWTLEHRNWEEIRCSKIEHFVDLQRNFYLPSNKLQVGELETLTAPSVTKLHQAGVKFKVETKKNLFEIRFDDGIMKIPKLHVTDRTEILIRNILAFEHCHCAEKYFTDYVVLMSRLITTPKDLELLVEYGIVEHTLGDSDEGSILIKNLTGGLAVHIDKFYFATLFEDMNIYCKNSWHNWKANLKQNYFNTPWTAISVAAAVVLLVLTLVQTICSIISLYVMLRG